MKKYLRFVKIEHTLFSLPIIFAGTLLALSQISASLTIGEFFWILLAATSARAAGFGLNRIIDRKLDAKNPRTQSRELPSGEISLSSAWTFVIIASLVFIFSAGMLSLLCLLLSPIPLILFWLYPYLKRWTIWSHLGLGIAWGIAPLGGYLAVYPHTNPWGQLLPAMLLALFCIFWVAGFDVIYALLDEEFDKKAELFSIPARLGTKNALRISEILHVTAFLFLGTLTHLYFPTSSSFVFLALIGTFLILSHLKIQFQPLTPKLIDFAFFKVNGVIAFLVLGLVFF